MIPKELFLRILDKIQRQRARVANFETALMEMCDGYPLFDRETLYFEALLELLKYTMKDKYDNIDWWLFEAPLSESYTIWWNEDGKEVSRDLSDPEALYDYLVEIAEEYVDDECAGPEMTDDKKIDIAVREILERHRADYEELAK